MIRKFGNASKDLSRMYLKLYAWMGKWARFSQCVAQEQQQQRQHLHEIMIGADP